MLSPLQNPLPQFEYTTSRVVVYFYSSSLCLWTPIMFLHLVEAISLYRKGVLYGAEFFVFPADLNPKVFSTNLVTEAKSPDNLTTASLKDDDLSDRLNPEDSADTPSQCPKSTLCERALSSLYSNFFLST
jgi:hypothetical protein